MPGDHVTGDGQTEPGPALVTAAGVVQTYEALEDPVPLRLGHARAVVGDLDEHVAPVGPHRDRHRTFRVTLGVVQEIAQHPGQLPP